MAFTYSDFEDSSQFGTTALKIARLELHISEVQARISADVSSDSKSVNYANLVAYLRDLRARLVQLQSRSDAGGTVNGGRNYARARRPG